MDDKPWLRREAPPVKETEEMLRTMVQQAPPQGSQNAPIASQGRPMPQQAPYGGNRGQDNSPLPSSPGSSYSEDIIRNQGGLSQQNAQFQRNSQINPQHQGFYSQPPAQRPFPGAQRQGMPSQFPPSSQPPKKSEVPARKKKAVLFWVMVGVVAVSAIALVTSVIVYFNQYG